MAGKSLIRRHTGNELETGPKVTQTESGWDTAEASYLSSQPATARGGYVRGAAFPGVPGFVIVDVDAVDIGPQTSRVSLRGRGVIGGQIKVFSSVRTYANTEQWSDIKVAGQGAPGGNTDVWPSATILLPSMGFEMEVYGLGGSGSQPPAAVQNLGKTVASPVYGSFPQAPANPWTKINTLNLNFPYNWVMVAADVAPLVTAGPGGSGVNMWGGRFSYVYRWRLTPGS